MVESVDQAQSAGAPSPGVTPLSANQSKAFKESAIDTVSDSFRDELADKVGGLDSPQNKKSIGLGLKQEEKPFIVMHDQIAEPIEPKKSDKPTKKGRTFKHKSDEAILKTLKNLSKDSQEMERRTRELSLIQEESQQQLLMLL